MRLLSSSSISIDNHNRVIFNEGEIPLFKRIFKYVGIISISQTWNNNTVSSLGIFDSIYLIRNLKEYALFLFDRHISGHTKLPLAQIRIIS